MKFPYQTVDQITPDLKGFYRISHEAYHAGPGLSSTRVKKALTSFASYMHQDDFDSNALSFGRAFHMALLEPGLFKANYVVWSGSVRRGKEWDYFCARQVGKEILTLEEYENIRQMVETVRAHPEQADCGDFQPEIMAIATCPDTGLLLKCKADLIGGTIIDYKTTSSGVHPSDFTHDVVKWRYHVSAAFYQDIIAILTGERLPFILVPVTKKAPFECEFYELAPELIEEGRKLYKAALKRIKKWNEDPKEAHVSEKKLRTLYPSARLVYSTQEILSFIEGV